RDRRRRRREPLRLSPRDLRCRGSGGTSLPPRLNALRPPVALRSMTLMTTKQILAAASLSLALIATAAVAGGKAGGPPPAAPEPAQLEAARAAAGKLLKTLGGELQAALGRGDVAAAITACAETAPRIARDISLAEGWQ